MFSTVCHVSVLLSLVLFIREAELAPTFTAQPADPFLTVEGNDITLVWQYNLGGSFDDVVLQFLGASTLTVVDKHDINKNATIPDIYKGRVQANITATHAIITILAVTRSDSGEYELELINSNRERAPSKVIVQVQYPPEFTNVSSDQVVVEGGPSVTLKCDADGFPTPTITWTRVYANGSDSGVLNTGKEFVLDNNRNNSGTYRCMAYNGIGTAPNRTIKVDVNFKPENFKLTVNDSTICQGDVISITCSAEGKPAVHTYQLFENEIPVTDGSSSAGVWTRVMSTAGDFTFRCVANNTVGTSQKNDTVTVKVPSVVYPLENITVIEGENRNLTCNVSGSPVVSVTWTAVSTGNQSMGKRRELTNIIRNDAGEYKCEARNDCGNASASTFLTVLFKPENFNFTVSESTVCQGYVVSFNCSADGKPPVDTYQLLENDTVVSNGSNSLGMWSRNMSIGGVFIYRCKAKNAAGTASSMSLPVTVNVPSSIQAIEDKTVTEGGNVNLSCHASGIPPPMVYWVKAGGQRVNGSVLMLTNINRSEAGEYRCEASNECGNATETTSIDVQFKPENVQLTTSAANNKACQGGVISLNCSADANPSVTSYKLFENDAAILDTNPSGMWSRNLTNGGVFIYKCVANNSVGSMYSANVTVTVNVPSSIQAIDDKTVTEGGSVTLSCNASGIPAPMVYWVKAGGQRVNGSVLMLPNITRNEAGEYRCEASNECGNATETANVDVHFKPENVQLTTSAANNKACQGDVMSLNCSADANPAVTSYQLFENDAAILDTNPSGMWSRNLSNAGMFIYKCVANNSVGSMYSANVTVSVIVNVPLSIQAIDDKTITEGGNVNLSCNASGIPPPMVYWVKAGSQRVNGSVLMLTNINRSEAGEYRCEASNDCSSATERASIIVQYKPENVQLTTSAANNKACQSDVISINCSADANPSVTSYQLFENDTAILDTNPSGMWRRNLTNGGVFIYKCKANNNLGSEYSTSVTVTVNVPSSIQAIEDQTVTEGGNVTLSCHASGMPPPMVSWLKADGQHVYGSVLMLPKVNRSEAGEYRCEASNECGNASETASIDVQYKPENVLLTTSAANNKACQGDVISINCSADAKPSVTSYQLFENYTAILATNTSGMWSKNLANGGVFIYKCKANNTLGSAYSTSVTVTVNVPSSIQQIDNKTITEGGSVTLSCNASGIPPPMVYWVKAGGQRVNRSVLMLTNITRNETGEYRCEASNDCGSATKRASIVVHYASKITHISGAQTRNTGKAVTLNCTAEGNPAPTVTWTKVSDNSSVNFPLTITGKQNEGLYRCTAQNGIGSPVTKDVRITVHFPALIVAMRNKTNIKKGEPVRLYCNVSGTPAPNVSWTHVQSGEKWHNRTWTIVNIQVENLGEYKCEARNIYGSDTKSTFIYYEGGLCEKVCLPGQSCRKFGTYVCVCPTGKKGKECKETAESKKTVVVGLKIEREFKKEYEDLENAETKKFVKEIEENTMEEFKGTGLTKVSVTALRQGSVIADMELTFNETVGENQVDALLTQAANDGKLGKLEVSEVSVGRPIKGPEEEEVQCGTFYEGEDCNKAKPGLIALCAVGGVVALALIVAIFAYCFHKKKTHIASFSNGTAARAEPDGIAAERTRGANNYGTVNTGYEFDRPNGRDQPTEMVTFKANPAQTPGITINDSSVTK